MLVDEGRYLNVKRVRVCIDEGMTPGRRLMGMCNFLTVCMQ